MLTIDHQTFHSHLLLGTAQYPSPDILSRAIHASQTEIMTVSLRRETSGNSSLREKKNDDALADQDKKKSNHVFWELLKSHNKTLLPNTAGCYQAKEAVLTAELSRELFGTHWIKLEVIGDQYTLQPDPFELVKAADMLIQRGFHVLPYCTDDLILCQRLADVGCQVLMPWAAPIGSGQGPLNINALTLLRERFPNHTLIVDAGIGKPSHAAQVMELGFDAVLINSAVALAHDPIQMAAAFAKSVEAGQLAYQAGLMPTRAMARASTPLIGEPFWRMNNLNA